jgi:hypothetical protein
LLGQENESGFRGLQSKSLVDIIQLECISQSSSVLRITNNALSGKIWIQDGELIDAETEELRGEAAFQKVLSWRTGTFETLPAEPTRARTIFKSYNGLLLETAQALDEQRGAVAANGSQVAPPSPLAQVSQIDGVEFVLLLKGGSTGQHEARGLENPERIAIWAHKNLERFHALGDRLQAGLLEQIEGLGQQRHVAVAQHGQDEFCVGWKLALGSGQIREQMKKVLALWAS